jgi:hypothetical protein
VGEPHLPPDEESGAELLDEVMRGERFIWLPPGGLVYAAVVPCLCVTSIPIAEMLMASVSGSRDVAPTIRSSDWRSPWSSFP